MAYPWLRQYDPGIPHTIGVYPERTLLDYLRDAVTERPDAPALLFMGRRISWRELDQASDAFAAALHDEGIRHGDRVVLVLPNCPQFFIAEWAAWKLGAIAVPLNPLYTKDELARAIRLTSPSHAVVLSMFYEKLKLAQEGTPLERIIVTNIKEWLPAVLSLAFTLLKEGKEGHRVKARDGDLLFKRLLREHAGRRAAADPPHPDVDALLLMSGGTTGEPKAVRVHHGALIRTGTQTRTLLKGILEDWTSVYCCPLPMFHSYGAAGVQPVCMMGHNPIALVPNPRDLDDLVRTIDRTKPAIFCGVPTLYSALLEHKRVKAGTVDFRSMKVCFSGAAPLMAETVRRFEAVTGARISEGWALTESCLAATVTPLRGKYKPGSVGIPNPDCVVRIVSVDDPTRTLPANEVGEILLTGPQIMRGYWGSDDATEEILHRHADGTTWLHTADLGYLDEEGSLFIVDRKKDLIKMGGMQVWPREIEEAIAAHPAVAEVGVRGFPDVRRGEVAIAFVVRRMGQAVTENDLRSWCKERLAPFKVPSRVIFQKDLPKTQVGKVLRRMLALPMALAMMLALACGPSSAGSRPAAAPDADTRPHRVLLVSLDGFRADYLDRPAAANLRALAARGVRAERMIPVFPSKTFPNHYSIVTGLTPEQHGIVANAIRDAELGMFRLTDSLAQRESRWWGGEPIWVTAEKQGRRAAALHWPGTEAAIGGVRPTWWSRYDSGLPHAAIVERVVRWLAMPADSAPALIVTYMSDVDNAGHRYGPAAPQVDSAVARVDRTMGEIIDGIARFGLTDVVDVIVVADHGMAPLARERVIALDDYIDLGDVEVVDWTPVAAIAPRDGAMERVYAALKDRHPHLQVYRKGEVPARFHFNAHPRITPIVAVADEGWTIASRREIAQWDSAQRTLGGTHGYDPELASMGALFVAAGPDIAQGKRVAPFRNVHLYSLMAHLLGVTPAPNGGSLDSVRNVLR